MGSGLKRKGSFRDVSFKKARIALPGGLVVRRKFRSVQRRAALGPELKSVDYAAADQSITAATATIINMTALIAQGTNYNTRVANKIMLKYLRLKFCLQQTNGAQIVNGRFIVFQDKGYNTAGTAPAWTDVMSGLPPEADRNFITSERFDLLYSQYCPATSNAVDKAFIVDVTIPLSRCMPCQFVGTTAAQASAGAGAIYFAFITDVTVTAATEVGQGRAGWDCWSRLAYYDN